METQEVQNKPKDGTVCLRANANPLLRTEVDWWLKEQDSNCRNTA